MKDFNRSFYVPLAIIIAGKPATGKTAALNTVVSALNSVQENTAAGVKLARIFPRAVEDFSDLFGRVNCVTGNWEDGIFTSIFRKAHKVCSVDIVTLLVIVLLLLFYCVNIVAAVVVIVFLLVVIVVV
jgi:Cdc6-like AAA superfamily ATPase